LSDFFYCLVKLILALIAAVVASISSSNSCVKETVVSLNVTTSKVPSIKSPPVDALKVMVLFVVFN